MKRIITLFFAVLLFIACVPTPDEEAVTSKADGALDALIAGETIDATVEGVDAEGETRSLRDRLGAPEHVTESLSGHVFGGQLDVTVDADGQVVCIEYNIRAPGVIMYQFAHGPMAGDATDELLSFLKEEKNAVWIPKSIRVR